MRQRTEHLLEHLGQSATLSFEYGPAGSTGGYVKYEGEVHYDLVPRLQQQ
jgi:hypothetical protein